MTDGEIKAYMSAATDLGGRAAFAKRQAEEHGQKEWKPGVPIKDVMGNRIVFKDSRGFRYTVVVADGDAHGRAEVPSPGSRSRLMWAHAATPLDAMEILSAMLLELGIDAASPDFRVTARWTEGETVIQEARFDPMPLD